MDEIRFFGPKGRYGWLSNFYMHKMSVRGVTYASVEHYYQAEKTLDPGLRADIRLAETPKLAKKLGQFVVLRPDWNNVRAGVMSVGLFAKFENERMSERLISTAPARLIENSPWDAYWGGKLPDSKNMLGYLLEIVRERLIADRAVL